MCVCVWVSVDDWVCCVWVLVLMCSTSHLSWHWQGQSVGWVSLAVKTLMGVTRTHSTHTHSTHTHTHTSSVWLSPGWLQLSRCYGTTNLFVAALSPVYPPELQQIVIALTHPHTVITQQHSRRRRWRISGVLKSHWSPVDVHLSSWKSHRWRASVLMCRSHRFVAAFFFFTLLMSEKRERNSVRDV